MILHTQTSATPPRSYVSSGEWDGKLVDDYVRDAAARQPNETVYIDRERSVTFAEFDRMVDQLSGALRATGVGRGDVVSWELPNWVEAAVIHHATLRIGAVSNPIVPIYREREVSFILRQAKSRVFFVPSTYRSFDFAAFAENLRTQVDTLEHVVVVGEPRDGHVTFDEFVQRGEDSAPSVPRAADDIVLLLYTSGTTADPKGVLHSHNTLNYENRSIIDLFELTADERIFMPSPVTHITGLLYGVQLPFMLGTLCVLQDVWDAETAVELIDRHRCSFCVGATPFLHGLLNKTADRTPGEFSLRKFGCGGADVPPELVRKGVEQLRGFVTRAYGSSEFPTALACGPGDDPEKWATTDGRRIGATELRIVDESGLPLEPGAEGELELRGAELFLGYLDDGLNEAAFTSDGWFRTGDLGVEDEDGFVAITGRKKDIILRGGENISAKEIEDLIFTHPDVAEVAVVGQPDPVLVERIRAVVVPKPGAHLELSDLTSLLRRHGIATQKLPESLVIVQDMPRTASGKIQKYVLRQQAKADGEAVS